MMVEVRQNGEEGEVVDSHLAFARLADASAKMFAEQAAAMAAMTAFGISVAGQMTGLMLGTLKPAEDKAADAPSERKPMNVVPTDDNIVHLRTKIEKSYGVVELEPKADEGLKLAPVAEAQLNKPEPKAKTVRAVKPAPRMAVNKSVTAKAASTVGVAKATPKPRSTSEQAADDLKRISGIGPRLEKVLNGRGISTYAQIAGLSAAALRKIDEELGLEGRVIRDDWVGQAKALAAGRPDAAR
jgi:NADH-quinone oxidoreductase subunit E